MTATQKLTHGLKTFASDVVEGFVEVSHNGFALLGLLVMLFGLVFSAQPGLRQIGELQLFDWLKDRQIAMVGYVSVNDAADRATAANPNSLPKQQASVAYWLSKKYRVAPEPLSALVAEAYALGRSKQMEPTLILAVMAIESGFNPFAQSPMGAQGLMQVMTRVHTDKYELFGGKMAAFDPLTNLRVGAKVLKDCIQAAGSLEGGLRAYVGAANLEEDGGYVNKVLAEFDRLNRVAAGMSVPMNSPAIVPVKDSINTGPAKPVQINS